MRTKKRKNKLSTTVKMSRMERMSLKTDREVLRDLGLKMPRITPKYWRAVKILSDLDFTSPYFYHLYAARAGLRAFYKSIIQQGYRWKNGTWRKTAQKSN